MLYREHEGFKEKQISDLNDEMNTLTAMNMQLNLLHSQSNIDESEKADGNLENIRKRIITYHKDELISLEADEIAYFFLENTSVYLRTHSRKLYTISSSLDELIRTLDPFRFYRANRQFIINISAVTQILVYGKNQLKIVVNPKSEDDLLISKNRVSEFKKWLEK